MSKRKLPTTKPIERRAYDLRLEQGCEDDYDLADWVAPERQLTELSEAPVLHRPAKLHRVLINALSSTGRRGFPHDDKRTSLTWVSSVD